MSTNQLLPPPHPFVDREQVLQRMTAAVEQARAQQRPALLSLEGPVGVGLTSTALRFHAMHREWFPDGAVHVRLSDVENNVLTTPEQALHSALYKLGCPVDDLPVSDADRADLVRARLADKRMLLLLSDAATVAQVKLFLSDAPGLVVLVTSRTRLAALRGIGFVRFVLDPLDEEHSAALLDAALERPWDPHDPLRARVVRLCGGFPLALQMVSAAMDGPEAAARRTLERALDRDGLGVFQVDGDNPVKRGFDFGALHLTREQTRAYRMLAYHPGAEFSLSAAAAILGADEETAAETVEALRRRHLVRAVDADRYRFPGLIRTHAREAAQADSAAAVLENQVVPRAAHWYLRMTVAHDVALSDRWRVGPLYLGWRGAKVLTDVQQRRQARVEALEWLERERENLVECVRAADKAGLDDVTWQFCEALWGLYHLHGHYDDWIETHERGLAAAKRLDDRLAAMHVSSQLASAHFAVGEYEQAREYFTYSRDRAGELDHAFGEQSAWEWLGKVCRALGEFDAALEAFADSERSTARLDPEDRPRAVALIRLQRGRTLNRAGRYSAAVADLSLAEEHFAGTAEADNQAKVAFALAESYAGQGDRAGERGHRALEIFREEGSRGHEAEVLVFLAEVAVQSVDLPKACDHLWRALEIQEQRFPRKAREIRRRLEELE